jgi:hypothetical protein
VKKDIVMRLWAVVNSRGKPMKAGMGEPYLFDRKSDAQWCARENSRHGQTYRVAKATVTVTSDSAKPEPTSAAD